jgi:glycosidase
MKSAFRKIVFLVCAVLSVGSVVRAEVMLQWFETDWDEMYRRLPKAAEVGYDFFWIPPPTKAPTGLGNKWSNVGYSLYDRFDIGDIPQRGSLATRYGTRGSLRNMIDKAHQLDIKIIPDIVVNHNGNGPNILEYPGMKPTDFHVEWAENYVNDLDFRRAPRMDQWYHLNGYGGTMWQDLANLIDIRTEDHILNGDPKRFTGPKTIEGRDFNFVDGTSFIRHIGQYDKYPYPAAYTNGENAADMLYRWIAWLGDAIDYDGLRLDAGKHIPYEFFGWHHAGFLHEAQWNYNLRHGYSDTGYPDDADTLFENYIHRDDALIFAEILSPWNEIEYWYGYGQNDRNPMRFLDYGMKQNAGESFNGDMSNLGAYGRDFGPNNGILYVWGHDEGGPAKIDLAYAYILTHVGFPMVYFTGSNISWDDYGRSPDKKTWMIPGYDSKALGLESGDITNLVWIHRQFARGKEVKRWEHDGDFFALERYDDLNGNDFPDVGEGLLLLGLNDSGGDITRNNVTVCFAEGTVLHDYTGHAGDITVYNNGGVMQVNLTVPGNGGQGWVCYAPRVAEAVRGGIEVTQAGSKVASMPWIVPGGVHGSDETMYLPRITDTNCDVEIYFSEPAGGSVDSVRLKWGQGLNLSGGMSTDISLVNYGYMDCVRRDATNWHFDVSSSSTNIPEGLNVIRARVFSQRPAGSPALFNTFTKVVYVDRHGPEVVVDYPREGATVDGDCVAVISNLDYTAYGMTVAVDGGSPQTAHEIMKGLWKIDLTGLSSGSHSLVVTTTEADWGDPRSIINTSVVSRSFNVVSNSASLAINRATGSRQEMPFFKTVVTAGGSPSDVKLYWDGYELPFNGGGYTNIFNGEVIYRDYLGNVETNHLWGNFVNGQHFFEAVSVVGGVTNRVVRRVEFDLWGGVAKYGWPGTIDSDGDGIPDCVEMPGFDQGAPGPDQPWPGDWNNNFIPEWDENWTRLNPYNNDTFYSGQWDDRNDFMAMVTVTTKRFIKDIWQVTFISMIFMTVLVIRVALRLICHRPVGLRQTGLPVVRNLQ